MGFLNGHFTTGISGGSEFSSQDFTTASIIATASSLQRWRYTGASAQTLAGIGNASVTNGTVLNIQGTSDTNTITIGPSDFINGFLLNGTWVGYRGSMISIQWDATLALWIEVSRNG